MPTSTDPSVATCFSTQAGCAAGRPSDGVVHIFNRNNPAITTRNNLTGISKEFEVLLDGVSPRQASELADITITRNQAADILKDFGVHIPLNIRTPTDLSRALDDVTDFGSRRSLTPEQINELVRRARELSK